MGFFDDIAESTGSAINPVLDQLRDVTDDVLNDPIVGPIAPNLPFRIRNPAELFDFLTDLAVGAVAAGLSPALAALIASYFQFLEVQATGRLKSIPEPL